jgi:hypothetical protein
MISLQLMCEAGWSSDQAHVRTVRPYNLSAWPRRKLSLGAHHWLSVRQAAELMLKTTRDAGRWNQSDDRWPRDAVANQLRVRQRTAVVVPDSLRSEIERRATRRNLELR